MLHKRFNDVLKNNDVLTGAKNYHVRGSRSEYLKSSPSISSCIWNFFFSFPSPETQISSLYSLHQTFRTFWTSKWKWKIMLTWAVTVYWTRQTEHASWSKRKPGRIFLIKSSSFRFPAFKAWRKIILWKIILWKIFWEEFIRLRGPIFAVFDGWVHILPL